MFRIFYATDAHASDVVFRKFLNAGSYYKADALLYGGDITGKALVLIERDADGKYRAEFLGAQEVVKGQEQLNTLVTKMMDRGYYYKIVESAEIQRLAENREEMRRMMIAEMIKRIEGWLELANRLYSKSNKKVYLLVGNDDPREILDTIRNNASESVLEINEKVFTLNNGMEGFGLPFSNITPWKLPGDITEDELESKIANLVSKLNDVPSSVFVIHVPPVNTAIDEAPLLADLRIKVDVTGVQTAHVGSTSVRAAIEKYQPLLSLHGHIHESRGVVRLGRTLCVNPGSEYEQGVLRGAIINIDEAARKVKSYLLVSG
jgi:Icc-related predicted phosphoesterase